MPRRLKSHPRNKRKDFTMFGKLTPEEAAKSREEKYGVFQDIIRRRKKPSRIPTISNDGLWRFLDQGLKLNEVLRDYDMIYEAVCKNQEEFGYDCQVDYGMLNRVKNQEAFGKSRFIIQDDPPSLQILDTFPMTAEDYPALIEKGITKFIFEDLLCRQFEYKSKEEVVAHLKPALEGLIEYQNAFGYIAGSMVNDYGTLTACYGSYQMPFEFFVSGLRGLKNISLDLRRHSEEVMDALYAIDERNWNNYISYAGSIKNDGSFVFDTYTCPMAYNLLSPKQFEKFYWPWMKKFFDFTTEHDQTAFIYAEGSVDNKIPYLQDLDEKRFGIMVEQDDPVTIREKLPNFTLIGGYPTTLLGESTPEKCVDKLKEMIEAVDYDGNWIFSWNKLASFQNDIKHENLSAVMDYIHNVKL